MSFRACDDETRARCFREVNGRYEVKERYRRGVRFFHANLAAPLTGVGWGTYDPDGPGPRAATSRAFLLTPLPVCSRADTNNDGRQTVQDIFDFLAAWFAGDIAVGNFNSDCCLSMQDVMDFLAAWFAGCR